MPAKFWVSPSATNPSTPLAANVGAVEGGTRFLNIWGQPETENAGGFDAVLNPFKVLRNFSFDVVLTDASAPVVDFLDPFITVYNPVLPDPGTMAPTQRFEFVNDATSGTPLTSLFDESQVAAGQKDAIERLQGFSITNSPDLTGFGGDGCHPDDPFCGATGDGSPAWLLATVAWKAVGNGNGEISMQIGANGINHQGESASAIQLTFGSDSEAIYTGDDRGVTLPGDLPDVTAPTVPTAVTTQWQGGSGDWASDNWNFAGPNPWPSWTEDALLGPGLGQDTVTVSANQEANSTTVESGRLLLATGATLSSDVGVGPGGQIGGDGSLSGSLALSGGFAIDSQQPLQIAGDADLTGASLSVSDGYSQAGGVSDEFQILEAAAGLTGAFSEVAGADLGNGFTLDSIRHTATGVFVTIEAPSLLLGDADGDGDVDGDDLIAVQTTFGSVTPPPGDADGDGDVDGDDLIAVQTNFGAILAVSIPEPTAASLAALCAFAWAAFRRV